MAGSRYASPVDLDDPNTAHTRIVRLVGGAKRVLDVGCAEGDVARALGAFGCTVSGVEMDPDAAEVARPDLEHLLVGDVTELDLLAEFGAASFDVVVFGDVLEHLADPASLLRQARPLLRRGGLVVISVPNVAHAAVRLSLLLGRWDYRPTGLLDATHIRFFTRSTLLELLNQAGFVPIQQQRTAFGPFDTEIPLDRAEVPLEVLDQVLQDPDATTYQFVVSAAPDDADGRWASLVSEHAALREERDRLREDYAFALSDVDRLTVEGDQRADALATLHEELAARANAPQEPVAAAPAEIARMTTEVERLAEQLRTSTTLLEREAHSVGKPILRRAYRLARRVGGHLSPEAQRRVRAALAPAVVRMAPRSPQADVYRRAATSGGPLGGAAPRERGLAVSRLAAGKPDAFDVIVLPVIDWHFRIQRPQHLAAGLARAGHRVVYLSPEFDRLRPGGAAFQLLEQVENNLYLGRLACPAPVPRIYRDAAALHQVGALSEAIAVLVEELGLSKVVLLAQHPFWEPVMWGCGQYLLAYDLIDDHGGFQGTASWVADAERRLAIGCDLVTTTAASLADKAPGAVVIRNAAEVERFAAPVQGARRATRPRVGYFGAIAHWFDTGLVEECARRHPDWDFVLIGSTEGAVTTGLQALANVTLTGELPYEELPSHLHGWDVCLIPFHVIPLTEHTNPVKAYEYLSAGKPVVATDLPEVRLMRPHVHVARDRQEFVAALELAMEESQDTALAEARRAWAQEHTWAARAALLDVAIEDRLPSVSVIVLCYNNLDFTKSCLESIERVGGHCDLQLVVVDNASSDGTVDFLNRFAQDRPHVTLVLNDANLGFAAGNNVGLSAATGDVLILLNNDTVVTDGWLLGLVRHLRDDRTLGLVGPVTNNIGNEAKVDVSYASIDGLATAAHGYTSTRFRRLLRVPVVAFFCVAMRRDVFEAVGGLDEDFGVGFFEDDDYCRRVADAGYDIAIAEDVFVHHHLSASFDALGAARKQEFFEKSRAVYEAKWGPWTPHVYRPDVPQLT